MHTYIYIIYVNFIFFTVDVMPHRIFINLINVDVDESLSVDILSVDIRLIPFFF